ncbi:alginate O-acetyltransferase AlgF [Aestuariibacter sp. AA17]|uniref:Alginate biosynthesis protein AlgF n=1 Tax=Fluctibacter corallii TaxID=2984329 RepID=A0ABT3A893_9ALTE|nr:alginate O-acetyltransferase AlgF [Aestuariibacter sp. AA17]MCV2884905.1 alginate O-acetyltransferase AlgF [Aestuariibacter sp. AA17]
MTFRIAILFSFLAIFTFNTAAEDALYAKLPPSDAAFFRFININSQTIDVAYDNKRIGNLSQGEVSRYGYESFGSFTFSIGGKPLTLELKKGELATIVLDDTAENGYFTISEQVFDNKRKARIKLYNLTQRPTLTLKTADGKHDVVNSVEPHTVGFRDINAVNMPFAAFAEDTAVITTDAVALTRNKVTSVFAFNVNQNTQVTVRESER